MKQLLILSFLLLSDGAFAQYADPNIPQPVSGYGSDGTHPVDVIAFANPNFPAMDIEIYHPADVSVKVPTIFYSHAFGGNDSDNIGGLLQFVAKKGYAIVFVPYQTTGVTMQQRYTNLLEGFRKAARDYPDVIDTTRVGFLGHSFGGGASFTHAYDCFTQNSWGSNGRFIYALAQWYTLYLSESELANFPADLKLLIEVFDDDYTNDHRMAADIFWNIPVPNTERDFLVLKSSTINGYVYAANHVVPNTSAAFDALDYYAYYRLLDALCDYTFNGSLAGKNVALGNGSTEQVTLPGGLTPLQQTDAPLVAHWQSQYEFPCNHMQNPRAFYCHEVDLGLSEETTQLLAIAPNPVSEILYAPLPLGSGKHIPAVHTLQGQVVNVPVAMQEDGVEIDVSGLAAGVYVLRIGAGVARFVKE